MAAGQGFKTFTTGEVLTAGDVNGYLMQGVLVFASAAARDAAITSPQEGQFAFLKDTNVTYYYDGAAWVVSGATGDITAVTAGTGISGGGASGDVTITNSMATAIDAKGDLVVGTGADAFSRLAVGTNNQILTADSTAATGVKWATASSGGAFTLLSTTTLSATTTTVSSISQSYKHLYIEILGIDTSNFNPTINYQTNSNALIWNVTQAAAATGVNYYNTNGTVGNAQNYGGNYGSGTNKTAMWVYDYTDAVNQKVGTFTQKWVNEGGSPIYFNGQLTTSHTGAMTSFSMVVSTGSYDGGTIKVYGVN